VVLPSRFKIAPLGISIVGVMYPAITGILSNDELGGGKINLSMPPKLSLVAIWTPTTKCQNIKTE